MAGRFCPAPSRRGATPSRSGPTAFTTTTPPGTPTATGARAPAWGGGGLGSIRGGRGPGAAGRLGGDLALPGDADAFFEGPTEAGLVMMGWQLASGDLDGDGYADLCATSHAYGNGTVWMFPGGPRRAGNYTYTDATATLSG